MRIPERKRAVTAFLAAIAIFAASSLVWNYRQLDRSHQTNDDGFRFLLTQEYYFALRDHGLVRGGFESYLNRGFRPILHPYLAVPYLFLTRGRTSLAVSLYVVTCFAAFLTFVALLLGEYLEATDLALSVLLVGINPMITAQAQGFRSELSMLAAFM